MTLPKISDYPKALEQQLAEVLRRIADDILEIHGDDEASLIEQAQATGCIHFALGSRPDAPRYEIANRISEPHSLTSQSFRIVRRYDPEDAYPHWICRDQCGGRWFRDRDDACSWYDDSDLPRPEYLVGSAPVFAELNADRILEALAESMVDEAPEDWGATEISEKFVGDIDLADAIAIFNERQIKENAVVYYRVDPDVRVYLPRRA